MLVAHYPFLCCFSLRLLIVSDSEFDFVAGRQPKSSDLLTYTINGN